MESNKLKLINIFINTIILCGILNLELIKSIIISIIYIYFYLVKDKKEFYLYSIFYLAVVFILNTNIDIIIMPIIFVIITWYTAFLTWDSQNKQIDYKNTILIKIATFITFCIIESMQGNLLQSIDILYGLEYGFFMQHLIMWANLIIIFSIFSIVNITIKNNKISFIVTSIPLLILGFINMIVLNITLKPLKPTDIFILTTALNAVKGQSLNSGIILKILIFLVLIVAFEYSFIKLIKNSNNSKKSALLSIIFIIAFYIGINSIELSKFNYNYEYGFLCGFVSDINIGMKKPEGYEKIEFKTLPEDNKIDDIKPNIILVMSEAFSDLNSTYNIETNEDPIPYFHSLQDKFPSGKLYSSVFGNNTVSSEFEAITGISTAFTDRGADIYTNYATTDLYNIGDYYKEFGYSKGIIHACNKENYNRMNVYNNMSYDKMIFLEDFNTDVESIRTFISDKTNFKYVSDLVRDTEEPLFLLNITIQNHSQYNEKVELEHSIEINNTNNKFRETENYLSLLRESDKELENFLDTIENIDEPTLVFIFGDHQPQLTDGFYDNFNSEQNTKTYEVPYLIWTNYEVNTDYKVPEQSSINYISLIINRYTGGKTTEWLDIMEDVQEHYPVITENFVIDNDNKISYINEIKKILAKSNKNLTDKELALKKYQFACYSFFDKEK